MPTPPAGNTETSREERLFPASEDRLQRDQRERYIDKKARALVRRIRHLLEYLPVRVAALVIGSLPRPLARAVGRGITAIFYYGHRRLVRVGRRNLVLAFPEMTVVERNHILRRLYTHLGRQMGEFCLFPRDRRDRIASVIATDGLEHYLAAHARGRGVLVLTAHLGAWELSSFAHSLNGYPMKFIVRPLDNPYLDKMVNGYRGLHGNQPISKRDSVRGLLLAMQSNESVGILLDQNSWPPQGVFVPFFGVAACTASGIAKIALRTGAAVVPGFALWEESRGQYVLYFEPALELIHGGDEETEVAANTAAFVSVIERWIRRYPDQWLWVHRRWKTRPEGSPGIY